MLRLLAETLVVPKSKLDCRASCGSLSFEGVKKKKYIRKATDGNMPSNVGMAYGRLGSDRRIWRESCTADSQLQQHF